MKNLALLFVAAFAVAGAFAEEESTESKGLHQKLSRDELIARRYAHTGGYVVRPNSRVGSIVILNAQTRLTSAELGGVVDKIKTKLGIYAEVREIPSATIAEAGKLKAEAKASVAVFLVDDQTLPMSLVAYEEHWGLVNVAKLAEGADKVSLFGRANAETMRVLALASGGADSQFPSSLMKEVRVVRTLDGMDAELPYDVMNRMAATYKQMGMSGEQKTTYRIACREGWAPAPTNDVQKAIWDSVHAVPTEPMKIRFKK